MKRASRRRANERTRSTVRRLLLEELECRCLLTGQFPSAIPLPLDAPQQLTGALDPTPVYYTFTVSESGRLTAEVVPTGGQARLALLSANGDLLLQSDGGSPQQAAASLDLHLTAAPAGTSYYLRVTGAAGAPASYSLSVTYAAATDPFVPLEVGASPWASATGDFDGDGNVDLAVAGYAEPTLSVYLGLGDGTFAPRQEYAIGQGANGVVIADFDGDGRLDLATANLEDGTVSLLMGRPGGAFAPAVSLSVPGASPAALTAGDFDGDGDADLAVADYASAAAVVLRNDGGTFAQAGTFAVGADPYGIASGDFDRDGALDLATANYGSDDVTVLHGRGDGTFAAGVAFPVGSQPYAIVAFDLDRDGALDLATANYGSDDVTVLHGRGDGSFWAGARQAAGDGPSGITAADVDGDELPDLIVGNNLDGTLSVLLGQGAGAFARPRSIAAGSALTNVNAADFDHDGALDLAFLDLASNTARVAVGRGDGSFQLPALSPSMAQLLDVVSADLDGDGRLDLAAIDYVRANGVVVFLGQQDGTFRFAGASSPGSDATALAASDLNGDGRIDLVTANYSTADVSVLLGNGDGSFGAATSFPAASVPSDVLIGDFDGDGRPDLAVAATGANQIAVLYGDGAGGVDAPQLHDVGASPVWVTAADFDGDGRLDLAASNTASADVSVLLNAGGRAFGTQQRFATGSRPQGIVSGDFDRDGRADLAASDDAGVTVLLNDGAGGFAAASVAVAGDLHDLLAGDFDGDGWLDLAALDRAANVVRLLRGAGDGTFTEGLAAPAGAVPYRGAVGDFDADGLLDLVTANSASSDLSVLLGRVGGGFSRSTLLLSNGPSTVATADFNSDGRPDVVTAAVSGGVVAVTLTGEGGTLRQAFAHAGAGEPSGVVAADFNLDGRPDVAFSDQRAGTVTVLLGIGDGTFEAKPAIAAGSRPGALTAGDFDHDGVADLAVLDPASDLVWILLGRGDGWFDVTGQFAAGDGPAAVAAADFDGDGRLDLAVGTHSREVRVLLGDGRGAFHGAEVKALPGTPGALSVGDFDRDGRADVAVTVPITGEVVVLLGRGGGALGDGARFDAGASAGPLVVSDVNQDGLLDLAVANPSEDAVSALIGRGDGTFGPRVTTDAGGWPLALAAADVDGDNTPDLILAKGRQAPLSVMLGRGDGSFLTTEVADRSRRATPLVADFDLDGRDDVAVLRLDGAILVRLGEDDGFAPPLVVNPDSPARDLALLRQNGRTFLVTLEVEGNALSVYGIFAGQPQLVLRLPVGASLPNRMAVGDLNGDGLEDVALLTLGTSEVLIGLQTPQGGGIIVRRLPVGVGSSDMHLMDVDGRHGLDVVVSDLFSGDVRVYLNDPVDPFATQARYRASTGLYGLRDLDGRPELYSQAMPVELAIGEDHDHGHLLVVNRGENRVTILSDNGLGGFDNPRPSLSLPTGESPVAVVTGFFNDDPFMDVVVLNAGSADLSVFLGSSDHDYAEVAAQGPDGQKLRPSAGNRPAGLTAHDVNRDGRLDLLVGNELGDVLTLLGNGDGTFQPYQRADRRVSLALLGSGADGQPTFAFANEAMDRVTVRSGTADPAFEQGRRDGILAPGLVRSADLNADGLPDLLVASGGANAVLVYLGQPDGQMGPASCFFVGTNPVGITTADLNQDGILDLVVANEGSNDVSILLGRGRGADWTLTPGPRLDAGRGPVATTVSDVTGDGLPDLLVANAGSNDVHLLPGVGNGFFRDNARAILRTGNEPRALFVGDFDSRPGLDLVTVNAGSSDLTFFTSFGPGESIGTGNARPVAAVSDDFDGDGALDVILAGRDGRFALLLGGGDRPSLSQVLEPALSDVADLALFGVADGRISFYVSVDGREEAIPFEFIFDREEGGESPSAGPTPLAPEPTLPADEDRTSEPSVQFSSPSGSPLEALAVLTFGADGAGGDGAAIALGAEESAASDSPQGGVASAAATVYQGSDEEEGFETDLAEEADESGERQRNALIAGADARPSLPPAGEPTPLSFPSPLEAFVPRASEASQSGNEPQTDVAQPAVEVEQPGQPEQSPAQGANETDEPDRWQWAERVGWGALALAAFVSAGLLLRPAVRRHREDPNSRSQP